MTFRRSLIWLLLVLLPLLGACADVPVQPPKVERLSAAQIEARLPQPVSTISLADIVAMSRDGMSTEEIVRRLDAAHARYRLSATQILDLQRQGVPLAVLDWIVAAERQAVFEDVAEDIAKREQACQAKLQAEISQCRRQSAPICWPPTFGFPYWRCI